ncbi:MAG: hypothetical protein JWO38_4784 [Gemmataceae bacterium]|nr:hypothetical protein [Gemmataceae bacterium]
MTARSLARVGCLFVAAVAGGFAPAGPPGLRATEPAAAEKGKPNKLAKESSPYLLQHAHNPVDWYPWGPEAFDRARKDKKLIFLSVGYSSCHWCHVMERESFSNPGVAKVLNEHFVCIKVDREERPDLDDVYMTALNVTGESGGWPLTMFLTPDGKPIFGGTYFPPEDKKVGDDTAPGLKSILKKVIELHAKERDGLFKQADRVAEMTVDALERNARGVPLITLTRDMVKDAAGAFAIDPEYGGIGTKKNDFRHAKFPRAAAWAFLLGQSGKPGNEALKKDVQLTLRKMAEGGIYDHLGGGFHRYSTERTWTVPHFEKMLYDNAQLVELYADAYRADPDPLYKRAVAGTLGFVKREMTSPDGAFYSALDADSNGKEGEFYVWTADEIKQVLGAESDVAFLRAVYGVTAPNFEEKYHILRLPKPTADLAKELKTTEDQLVARLEPLKAKLLAARGKRERPFLDTKVIAGWNGQMIAAYARAGEVFQDKAYTAAAATAADFLLKTLRARDGRLLRLYAAAPGEKPAARGNAYLDDYAYLVHGLLNLHDATGEKRWLDEARALADTLMKWHADTTRGGFFYTAHDHEKLFARAKDGYDGAQPSGNGVQARNLIRLWRKTDDLKYRDFGFRTVKSFAGVLRTSPSSVPGIARALDELLDIADKDPTAIEPKSPLTPTDPPRNPKTSADVVKAELTVGPAGADGTQPFTVTLTVTAPWHVYANPAGTDTLKASETTVDATVGGKKVAVAVEFPKGDVAKDTTAGEYRVYAGTVKLTGKVTRGKDDGPLEVRVHVTACKEGTCLLPSVLKLAAGK